MLLEHELWLYASRNEAARAHFADLLNGGYKLAYRSMLDCSTGTGSHELDAVNGGAAGAADAVRGIGIRHKSEAPGGQAAEPHIGAGGDMIQTGVLDLSRGIRRRSDKPAGVPDEESAAAPDSKWCRLRRRRRHCPGNARAGGSSSAGPRCAAPRSRRVSYSPRQTGRRVSCRAISVRA